VATTNDEDENRGNDDEGAPNLPVVNHEEALQPPEVSKEEAINHHQ
jgi:hypothetical protein